MPLVPPVTKAVLWFGTSAVMVVFGEAIVRKVAQQDRWCVDRYSRL